MRTVHHVSAAALLALSVIGLPTAAGAAPATCGNYTAQPTDVATSTQLEAVAVTSSCNAWAVGWSGMATNTVIERFNGTKWVVQTSPNPGGTSGSWFYGATAVSSSAAWAAGAYVDGNGHDQTLVAHWNGTRWRTQQTPDPGGSSRENDFFAVTATSKSNGWAVGSYDDGSGTQALIAHWNGTAWHRQPAPSPGGTQGTVLRGVAAASASRAWAVGYFGTTHKPLLERWNGTAWKRVRRLGTTVTHGSLYGVCALSATSAWAVGNSVNSTGDDHTFVLHWNGTRWHQQKSPNVDASWNILSGVTAVSGSNVWAAGEDSSPKKTLVEHYNGAAWHVVTSPAPPTSSLLTGAAATTGTDGWAVGYSTDSSFDNHVLAVHL